MAFAEGLTIGEQGQLYRDVLTSIRPANILNQFTARLGEPFQVDPNPPHVAPLRYPDLLTIPGVFGDPTPPERRAAVGAALQFNTVVEPVPMEVDWQAEMGTTQLVEVGTELLGRQELFRRAFAPRTLTQMPAPWDFQR